MKEHYKIKLKCGASEKDFEIFLISKSITFEKISYFSECHIYKIPIPSQEIIEIIKKRDDVFYSETMKRYFLDFKTRAIDEKINFSQKSSDVVIGVLDNGIADLESIKNRVIKNHTLKDDMYPTHGTFIAGVILKESIYTPCKVFDGGIVPDFNKIHLEEDELLLRLKHMIESNLYIKIWNLAISIRYSVDLNRISEFGLLLDYLQEKYDILILKSCGNGKFSKDEIKKREPILIGADSIRSLVVASNNKDNQISSFSLSGKGHKFLIKPDVSTYGGDIKVKDGKIKVEKVVSISTQNSIVSSFGTSFATARISQIVGGLLNIRSQSTPLFIKCFLVSLATDGKPYLTGFGCIDDFDIDEKLKEITVYEDELINEKIIKLDDTKSYEITLSTDIIVDYYQKDEYVLSDIVIENEKNPIKLTNLKKYFIKDRSEIKLIYRGNCGKKLKYCVIIKEKCNKKEQ